MEVVWGRVECTCVTAEWLLESEGLLHWDFLVGLRLFFMVPHWSAGGWVGRFCCLSSAGDGKAAPQELGQISRGVWETGALVW